jgi:hypothetical protein
MICRGIIETAEKVKGKKEKGRATAENAETAEKVKSRK